MPQKKKMESRVRGTGDAGVDACSMKYYIKCTSSQSGPN